MKNKVNFKDLLLRAEQLSDDGLFFRAVDKLNNYMKAAYKGLMNKGRFYIFGEFAVEDFSFTDQGVEYSGHAMPTEGLIQQDLGRFIALLLSPKPKTFEILTLKKLIRKFSAEFHVPYGSILYYAHANLSNGLKAVNSLVDKIVVCPDSFKGTMSASEVSGIIKKEIIAIYPHATVSEVPIADGGEGTLECFKSAVNCRAVTVPVKDAYLNHIQAEYICLEDGTAVIEAAKAIGLNLIKIKNPEKTTSYGVGQLIAAAAAEKRNVLLALGGSSTNDGGAGIAAACGARFYGKEGEIAFPDGAALREIIKIDLSGLIQADITSMCDVENPMYGERGAAYIYAPQKGADADAVRRLDEGLKNLADKIEESTGRDISGLKGGGAAGGIAAGMAGFFGARLKSGIDTVLDSVGFDKLISDAQLIITGEGKLDNTSFLGKALSGILKRASAAHVPVMAVCGQVDDNTDVSALKGAYATNQTMLLFEDIKGGCRADLKNTVNRIISTETLF